MIEFIITNVMTRDNEPDHFEATLLLGKTTKQRNEIINKLLDYRMSGCVLRLDDLLGTKNKNTRLAISLIGFDSIDSKGKKFDFNLKPIVPISGKRSNKK